MENILDKYTTVLAADVTTWFKAGTVKDFLAIEEVVLNTKTSKLPFLISKEEISGTLAKMPVRIN